MQNKTINQTCLTTRRSHVEPVISMRLPETCMTGSRFPSPAGSFNSGISSDERRRAKSNRGDTEGRTTALQEDANGTNVKSLHSKFIPGHSENSSCTSTGNVATCWHDKNTKLFLESKPATSKDQLSAPHGHKREPCLLLRPNRINNFACGVIFSAWCHRVVTGDRRDGPLNKGMCVRRGNPPNLIWHDEHVYHAGLFSQRNQTSVGSGEPWRVEQKMRCRQAPYRGLMIERYILSEGLGGVSLRTAHHPKIADNQQPNKGEA